jgi:hypothetical protein
VAATALTPASGAGILSSTAISVTAFRQKASETLALRTGSLLQLFQQPGPAVAHLQLFTAFIVSLASASWLLPPGYFLELLNCPLITIATVATATADCYHLCHCHHLHCCCSSTATSAILSLCYHLSLIKSRQKRPLKRSLLLGLVLQHQGQHRTHKVSWSACLYDHKRRVARLYQSWQSFKDWVCTCHGSVPHAIKGLCLHQSQIFCWATKGSPPPLAWVELAAGSSRIHWGLWWQKVQHKPFETVVSGTAPSGAGVEL